MLLRPKDLVCEQAVALVSDYLEGSLTRRDRRRLERHLRGCANCAAYLEQIRLTIEATGRIDPGDLSQAAVDDLVDLYRQWRAEGPDDS